MTIEEFMALTDKRVELANGALQRLPPRFFDEGAAVSALASELSMFVRKNKLGKMALGGLFQIGDQELRTPLASFLSNVDLEGEELSTYIRKAPTWCAERDAPGGFRAQRWLDAGTREVWLLNIEQRSVKVWPVDGDTKVWSFGQTLTGSVVFPTLHIPLQGVFGD